MTTAEEPRASVQVNKHKHNGVHLNREMLQRMCHMKMDPVAEALGMNKHSLIRACRSLGIQSWGHERRLVAATMHSSDDDDIDSRRSQLAKAEEARNKALAERLEARNKALAERLAAAALLAAASKQANAGDANATAQVAQLAAMPAALTVSNGMYRGLSTGTNFQKVLSTVYKVNILGH